MVVKGQAGYGQVNVGERSISARTSSKATSISHNNRTVEDEAKLKNIDKHVDFSRTDKNVLLVADDIKDVYEELFHESVVKYNNKQKRKDRKLDEKKGGYLNKILSEKKNGALDEQREFIVQFGTKDDEPINVDVSNRMFKEYYEGFVERYPDLRVYNAVIHNDESTPHMHINFVPVAEGYKTGMDKRPSFSKVLKAHNIEFKEFFENERDLLANILKEHTGENRRLVGTHDYLKPHQYREAMQEVNEKRAKVTKAESVVRNTANVVNGKIHEINSDRQQLDLERAELETAKLEHEQQKEADEKALREREIAVAEREQNVKELTDYWKQLKEQTEGIQERINEKLGVFSLTWRKVLRAVKSREIEKPQVEQVVEKHVPLKTEKDVDDLTLSLDELIKPKQQGLQR